MSDQKIDQTTAARSRAPVAEPYEVGISSLVKKRLDEIGIHPSIKQRIAAHLEKKSG